MKMDDFEDDSVKELSVKERVAIFEKMDNIAVKQVNIKERAALFEKIFQPRESANVAVVREKQSKSLGNKDWESDIHKSSDNETNSHEAFNEKDWTSNIRSKYGNLRVFQEPLCLIKNDRSGKLSIVQSVMKEISTIEDTVNVIAIAGPYRSGKSYLLNRLAGVKRGFAVSSSVDAMTKGIWVWCVAHPKQKHVLMLLDTEGIGDVMKGDDKDAYNILCLATLLSGTFVYNVLGVVDHDLLKKLSFVTKMSEKIVMSNALPKKYFDLGLFFPTLVLCLRDFSLHIGNNATADEYFENCLGKKEEKGNEKSMYNEIKSSITDLFQRRKCFVFDRPIGNREKLQKLEEIEEAELTEDFRNDTEKFLKYMLCCQPKTLIDDSLYNGRMFASMTESYTKSLAKGELPCIDDALTLMAKQENDIAVKKSVEMFEQELDALGLPLPDDFESRYQQIQRDALKHFRQIAVHDDNNIFQKEAETAMDSIKEQIKEKNKDFLQRKCFQESQSMYDELIQPKVAKGTYLVTGGYQQYRQDFARLKEKLKEKLSGIDYNFLETVGLDFEARYRQQDQEILKKTSKSEIERKAEIEKQEEKLRKVKAELLKVEELKRKREADEFKAYKEKMEAEMKKERRELIQTYEKKIAEWEKKYEMKAYKEKMDAEREKEQKKLIEKHEKELAHWKEKNEQLQEKVNEQNENISGLKNDCDALALVNKPSGNDTVLRILVGLIPIVGPFAAAAIEKRDAKKKIKKT